MTDQERAAVRARRGYWIRLGRKARGWTQKQLGVALGYGENATGNLSKWESGERPVPSDMFTPLARALGLPPRYLISPPLTDQERLDAAIAAASALETEDWDAGEDRYPADDDEPGDEPGRRIA